MISLGGKRIKISFQSSSLMACDLLIIFIIVVASKTTFNTGGKTLFTQYWYFLLLENVGALISLEVSYMNLKVTFIRFME